jgi:threonine/homoserine/homoserine lactone efflux protein
VTDALFHYISVTFFLVITPGVTTAVVVQHTLSHGRRAGALAALGAACGNSTYAIAAGLGVDVLFHESPEAFEVLRGLGAIYLCWLGVRALWRAWKGPRAATGPDVERSPAFRQGYTVTLLNPSVATFYFAVIPGFMTSAATFSRFAPLAAIHVMMALTCHLIWTFTVGAFRAQLAAPTMMRWIDAIGGVALFLLGISMLY